MNHCHACLPPLAWRGWSGARSVHCMHGTCQLHGECTFFRLSSSSERARSPLERGRDAQGVEPDAAHIAHQLPPRADQVKRRAYCCGITPALTNLRCHQHLSYNSQFSSIQTLSSGLGRAQAAQQSASAGTPLICMSCACTAAGSPCYDQPAGRVRISLTTHDAHQVSCSTK